MEKLEKLKEADGPSLTGDAPRERAHISMMNMRAENGLLNAVSNYFHHATEGLGPDLEVYQNEDWGLKQKEVATKTMAYLDEVLGQNPYVAGDSFSMADITAFEGSRLRISPKSTSPPISPIFQRGVRK